MRGASEGVLWAGVRFRLRAVNPGGYGPAVCGRQHLLGSHRLIGQPDVDDGTVPVGRSNVPWHASWRV